MLLKRPLLSVYLKVLTRWLTRLGKMQWNFPIIIYMIVVVAVVVVVVVATAVVAAVAAVVNIMSIYHVHIPELCDIPSASHAINFFLVALIHLPTFFEPVLVFMQQEGSNTLCRVCTCLYHT